MNDEPYQLSLSGERWYVSGPGVMLPFDCQIEAMQMQSACNEAYRLGSVTDEQTGAVKALRDACVKTTDEMMKLAMHCYDKNLIKYQHFLEWSELSFQATEAIKEVERWIV